MGENTQREVRRFNNKNKKIVLEGIIVVKTIEWTLGLWIRVQEDKRASLGPRTVPSRLVSHTQ